MGLKHKTSASEYLLTPYSLWGKKKYDRGILLQNLLKIFTDNNAFGECVISFKEFCAPYILDIKVLQKLNFYYLKVAHINIFNFSIIKTETISFFFPNIQM